MDMISVTVEGRAFAAALKRAASVIEASPIPALSHVAMKAARGTLTVAATNLNQWASIGLPYEGDGGSACLPAKTLLTITAPDHPVSLRSTANGQFVMAKSGAFSARMVPLPMTDVEVLTAPQIADAFSVEFSGTEIIDVLNRVGPAAHDGADRPYLCGIEIEANGGKLAFVATNGHSIHLIESEMAGADWNAILPRETFRPLSTILTQAPVIMRISESLISFEQENALFLTKRISGEYPDWRARTADPREDQIFKADAKEMASALACIAPLGDNNKLGGGVIILSNAENGVLFVDADGGQFATATFGIDAALPLPPVAFSRKRLAMALDAMGDGDLTVRGSAWASSQIIRLCGRDFSAIIFSLVHSPRLRDAEAALREDT
jgi:DNA polymerase III sliding clamp (beta) subunit (PCNA family)